MRLQIGRVDHDRPAIGLLGGEPLHDPGEHAHAAPSDPAIVERLVRAVFTRRIPPPQAVAIDEYNPAQNTLVIDPRLAMRLRKVGPQPLHLRVAQPVKIAHRQPPSGEG